MNKSGLGRPGAQNEYFRNKALIRNERIRARAARGPNSILLKMKLLSKMNGSALGRPGAQNEDF